MTTPTIARRDPAALRALIAALDAPTTPPAPIDVACADCGHAGLWRPGDEHVAHGEQRCRVRQPRGTAMRVATVKQGRGQR